VVRAENVKRHAALRNDSSEWLFKKTNFNFRIVFARSPSTRMVGTQTISMLIDKKTKLEQAARAIHIFEYGSSDNSKPEKRIIAAMKRNLNDAHAAFEAQFAVLSEEERWQFMLRSMLTGALEDDFEFDI
jgi:hypothetical protein